MYKIKQFVFNPFGECTYLVYDEDTADAIVVDPGMCCDNECRAFDEYVRNDNLKIRHIVNTHLHLDHCFGDNYVKNKYGVDIMAHQDDAPLGATMAEQCRRFGMRWPDDGVLIDTPIADGDEIALGHSKLVVLHVPGHSPGGIALYNADGRFVIAGDSLFKGAIGRTDLQGGSYPQLIKSIEERLLTLPDDTLVLSGHGDPTTIGEERRSNPYL